MKRFENRIRLGTWQPEIAQRVCVIFTLCASLLTSAQAQSEAVKLETVGSRRSYSIDLLRLQHELNALFLATDLNAGEFNDLIGAFGELSWADVLSEGATADRNISLGHFNLEDVGNAQVNLILADSMRVDQIINGRVGSLDNHTSDSLAEGLHHRYYTQLREEGIQAQLDSINNFLGSILNQLLNPATVTTDPATEVSAFSASLNGSFEDGGSEVVASGFELSLQSDFSEPSIYDATGSGSFAEALSGLTKGTTYYYRAFAEIPLGRVVGDILNFVTVGDAEVSTGTASDVTIATVQLNGTLVGNGGGTIEDAGFEYSTNSTFGDATTISVGSISGEFAATATDLEGETTYYFRGFATNEAGIVYGDSSSFMTEPYLPCSGASSITFDDDEYSLVEIRDQCWFAENLKTTHYADGTSIPELTAAEDWSNATIGARSAFANDSANLSTVGYLYNWSAVNDAAGLCPSGWHVPTDAEWTALTDFLGGEATAGAKLKSAPSDSPGWDGTNATGFSGLPGGDRNGFYGYFDNSNSGYWWTATSNSPTTSWFRLLGTDFVGVYRAAVTNSYGNSIRCLKDASDEGTADEDATNEEPPSLSDPTCASSSIEFDGQSYNVVQVGTQCWFKENLRTTQYANGLPIPQVTEPASWTTAQEGARVAYSNDSTGLATNGYLYNGFAVNDESGLCPAGWRVPSDADWTTLADALGGNAVAGGKMKSSSSDNPAWDGTNDSGFQALPTGIRDHFDGAFLNGETDAAWWSSTAGGSGAWYRKLYANQESLDPFTGFMQFGFSVRCVQEAESGTGS